MQEILLTLDEAVAWLRTETNEDWSAVGILTKGLEGTISLVASIPGWKIEGNGELTMIFTEADLAQVVAQGVSLEEAIELVGRPVGVVSNGFAPLTPRLIENLLQHKQAWLGALPGSAGDDAPFITEDHVRVSQDELARISRASEANTIWAASEANNEPRWLSKREIIALFQNVYGDANYWRNATCKHWPKAFAAARKRGRVGHREGSEYHPVELANALQGPGYSVVRKRLNAAFNLMPKLSDELAPWKEIWEKLSKEAE